MDIKSYKNILKTLPETVIEMDMDFNVNFINTFGKKILGYSDTELKTLNLFDIIKPDSSIHTDIDLNTVPYFKDPCSYEVNFIKKDKTVFHTRLSLCPILKGKKIIGILGIAFDISEIKRLEERLLKSEEKLQRISNIALEGIVFNDSGIIIDANKAFLNMLGYELDEILGKNLIDLSLAEYRDIIFDYLKMRETAPCEIKAVKKSGEAFDVEFTSKSMVQDGRKIYAVVVQDISHRKRVEYIQVHDELTGLLNYRGLVKKLKDELRQAVYRNKKIAVMTIRIDVDRLNVIKDLEPELEKVLIKAIPMEIAEKLTDILFKEDTISRVDENEYITLHPLLANHDISNSVKLIKKLLDIFSSEFIKGIQLVAHIGVTFFPDDYKIDNPITIINNSKYACEEAIRNNKEYMFYDENSHRETRERIEFVKDLIIAVKEEQCLSFFLHYQPKVNTKCKIVGAEALIRWDMPKWNDPSLGYVPPTRFIKTAEETGLITELGNWVLKEACKQIKKWQDTTEQNNQLQIAINVSPSQLNEKFLQYIDEVLSETGLSPESLELEITERESIKEKNVTILDQLKKKKISIAIDDFGIDYSSLSKLPKLAINTIKLDKSYIDEIVTDSDYENLVYYTIKMVHEFNYSVVAEGVEERVQVDKLFNDMECDKIQGFYFSKPLSPEAFEELLVSDILYEKIQD